MSESKQKQPAVQPPPLPPESQGERWAKYGSNVILTCVIVIVIAAIAVYCMQRWDHRADLTMGSSESLKPQTVGIVKDIKEPIKLVAIYARLKSNQPDEQDYSTPVTDLLEQYRRAGHDIQTESIDMVSEPAKLDAWLVEITQKYGGNVKAYRDVLKEFPTTIKKITQLAGDQVAEMRKLKDVNVTSQDQADTVNEAFGTVAAFPTLLSSLNEGIADELTKKIPDYKGQVESVRSGLSSFSHQIEGVEKDLDTLQKDQTAPQQFRDLSKSLKPKFDDMKKLADDLLAKIKGLGELKLDEVRKKITTEDESGNDRQLAIAVEGKDDFRLINFHQLWRNGDTTSMLSANSGPPKLRFSGEQQVTAAILSLEQAKKPKVCFVRSGGAPLTTPMFGQADFSDAADRLRAYNFEVQEKDLSGQFQMEMMQRGMGQMPEPSDEDIKDSIWVVLPMTGQQSQFGPQPLSPEISQKISEHLAHGGSALFLFQPDCDALHGVLAEWGIDVKPNLIIVHEPVPSNDQATDDFVEMARRMPHIFILNQYGDSPVTKTLQTLDAALVPLNPVDTRTESGVTTTKILPIPETLKIWGESDLSSIGRGHTPTYDPKSGDLAPPLWAGAIAEKKDGGRVVVIGNASFISNQLLEFPDPQMAKSKLDVARFPGNGELFANSIFWLSHMDNLIALSPAALDTSRIRPISPFVLQFWRVGILLFGLPLLAIVAGVVMYQVRKD